METNMDQHTMPQENHSPAVPPSDMRTGEPKSGPRGLFIVIGIVIVAILASVYYFMNSQRTSQTAQSVVPKSNQEAQSTTIKSLESEVNALEIESSDPDFADVDKDLQSL